METRARSRRMDPPDVGRTTRSARQRELPSRDVAHPQAIQTQGSQTTPDSSKRVGLGALPFARRGARATSREASIASIRTVPFRADDETILGEGDSVSEMPVDDTFAASSQREDDGPAQKALETKLKIIELSMGDLAASTAELWQYLKYADYENDVSRGRLKIKKRTFDSVRESFTEETTAPFINLAQVEDIWKSEKETAAGATVIVRANIVTALYEVTALQKSMETNLFPLLDKLDSFFNLFFLYPEEIFEYPEVPELLLDIRTWCLIETLDKLSIKPNVPTTIASIFCEPSDKDLFKRLAAGPYRGLGEPSSERLEELCSSRISRLVPIINKDRKTYGVPALKEEFPLENLLDQLRVWLEAMYSEKDGNSQTEEKREPARFPNFEEDFADSQTTASESQPIIRPGAGEENRTSLFVDKESIQYFNNRSRNNLSVPPSNQHQIMPPPGAPRDYQEHTNSELLASPGPSSLAFGHTSKQKTAAEPARKRTRQPFIEQEEDDEDEWFETDNRPVAPAKRAPFEASPPPPKRARLEIVPQSSPPRSSLHKSTAPPSSRPSEMIRSSQPTRADFDTLRQAKEQVSQQARATLSPFVRQRYSWSHNDMRLLLQFIRDRHAAWANIEKYDNAKFEHPRNQQAFRDKARNMKVDYLITDAVLPPCFDLVALGKKEVDRLISLGKNPNRKEDDVDQNGRAINTEYIHQ